MNDSGTPTPGSGGDAPRLVGDIVRQPPTLSGIARALEAARDAYDRGHHDALRHILAEQRADLLALAQLAGSDAFWQLVMEHLADVVDLLMQMLAGGARPDTFRSELGDAVRQVKSAGGAR